MGETKSVVIKLTNEQRDAIKRATGQDFTELKVEAMEGRESPLAATRLELRKAPWGEGRDAMEARKAPFGGGDKDAVEARKAPFGGGDDVTQRKAPFGGGDDLTQRKAPFGTGEKE